MKINKSFLAVLIVSFLIAASVYGEEVIVNPQRSGTIVIHKVAVENLEEYTDPATGEINDTEGMTLLENITFTVIRVEDDTEDAENAEALQGADAYAESIATGSDGKAEFSNLAHGIYLVREETSPSVEAPVEDFLVRIPMTNPTGNGLLYDVHVYPKNQLAKLPQLGGSVGDRGGQSISLSAGESVTWTTSVGIPKDIAKAPLFKLMFTLNEYMLYDSDSISVYTENQQEEEVRLEIDKDFSFNNENNQLSVEITEAGKTILGEEIEAGSEGVTPVLYIEYATGLNYEAEDFINALGIPLYNETKLFYTNALNIEHTSELPKEEQPYVYTGGMSIEKIDARSEIGLSGAVFQIYGSSDDAQKRENPLLEPGTAEPWTVITGNQGNASFYGLAYGEADGDIDTGKSKYYIVETQAPEGYNLMGSPAEIEVNAVSHLENNAVIVKNSTGFILPVTGGTGTLIFSIAGIGIIAVSAYILFSAVRKKSL